MAGLEGKSVEEIQALAELANNLASDTKTRSRFLHLTKEANPGASIPEVDIPAQIRAQFEEPFKQLKALTLAEEKREFQDQIESRRREIISKGVDPKDVEKVEKLMVEKSIVNHETAVEYMRLSERAAIPTPAPTGNGLRRYDKPTMPDLKSHNGDQKAWSYATANSVIDELRGRRPVSS